MFFVNMNLLDTAMTVLYCFRIGLVHPKSPRYPVFGQTSLIFLNKFDDLSLSLVFQF